MSARGFVGSGDLYINRIVGGVAQGWVGPYEVTKFSIKPTVKSLEQTSRSKSNYGAVIETVNLPGAAELEIELPEVNRETMAIAMLASIATVTQVAGTVTDEVVTTAANTWAQLAKAKVAITSVKSFNGSDTYIAGEDYLVNTELGWIKPIAVADGGSIVPGSQIKVSYSASAISGSALAGQTQGDVRAKFKLDGKNLVDESPCIVTIHEGVIAANDAFDFMADQFASVKLTGKMKKPAGFNEPFSIEQRDLV